jgi:tetratricopeptide (TPR) repeat protein
MGYLDAAEQVLADSKVISQIDRQEELARLLRLRAEWLARMGRFSEAKSSLRTLDAMVAGSRSHSLRNTSAGAQGAVLLYEGKYADAVASLELDTNNPFSLYRLAVAYQQMGKPDLSQETQTLLLALNDPSPEQALLLPVVRDRILAAK